MGSGIRPGYKGRVGLGTWHYLPPGKVGRNVVPEGKDSDVVTSHDPRYGTFPLP